MKIRTRPLALCAISAACLLALLPAHAQTRQLLASANDAKVELVNGVVTPRASANQDTVTIYDTTQSPPREIARVDVPTSVVGPPQSIAFTPDLSAVIVTAATRFDPTDRRKVIDGNTVSVIDLQSNPPGVVQSLTVGAGPAGLAVAPDGKMVIVTERSAHGLLVYTLDNKRLTLKERIAMPDRSAPAGVAFTPDGKRALITRDGDNSRIMVFNVDAGTIKATGREIYVGNRPYDIHITPDGRWAVVGNVGSSQGGDADTISLIDLSAPMPRSVDHAVVGTTAEGVAVSPDSRFAAAVAHDGSNRPSNHPFYKAQGKLSIFRIDNGKLVPHGTAPMGGWGQGAAFSADSRRIYVQSMTDRNIAVYDITAAGVVDSGQRIALPGGGAALRLSAR